MCTGKPLRTAARSELISAWTTITKHLKFPVPILGQCRLAQLNWEYCINKQEWYQAALVVKVWVLPEEHTTCADWSGLTVGWILSINLHQDEKEVVSQLLPVMFFSSAVFRLFDQEIEDDVGSPYNLCAAILKLEQQASQDLSEQIYAQPELALQNFEDMVEACQDHTPGLFGCTYERLSVILAGDKFAIGEEATLSLELQAFLRTMKRNKTWGGSVV